MLAIVVRGNSGTVTWFRQAVGHSSYNWVCSRDGFVVVPPKTPAQLESVLVAMAQHSLAFTWTLAQVVQLDI